MQLGTIKAINLMLKGGLTADELHQEIEDAVDWIEAHPYATEYLPNLPE